MSENKGERYRKPEVEEYGSVDAITETFSNKDSWGADADIRCIPIASQSFSH